VVDVRDHDGIPGVASQRTRFESAEVVGEVEDDHFHHFVREWEGQSMRRVRPCNLDAEELDDLGFSSVPTALQVYPYGVNGGDQIQLCVLMGSHT